MSFYATFHCCFLLWVKANFNIQRNENTLTWVIPTFLYGHTAASLGLWLETTVQTWNDMFSGQKQRNLSLRRMAFNSRFEGYFFSFALQCNSTWIDSGWNCQIAWNCLTYMLDYNVMQMRRVNCERAVYFTPYT